VAGGRRRPLRDRPRLDTASAARGDAAAARPRPAGRRLATDDSLPRSIRWRLLLLLGYLVSPIDLVPDFIPVAGYADDALLLALVLRSVVRAAGPEALDRHWPGSPDGLTVVRRLAGL
jgi:uncharacterized membrane protein YkvA (DUF1232 family)